MGRVPHPYYINPGYGLSLVDTLWNASSYRQPLEQEGDPMTWIEKFWLQISLIVAKEVINVPPVPSISRCIHIVYRHKNVWEYQWSNFIYNCMSTFLHYVHCKDALLDCSAPGGERCESLTWVDENYYVDLECCVATVCHQEWGAVSYSSLSITQVKIYSSPYLTRLTLEHRCSAALDPYIPTWLTTSPANHRPANFWFFLALLVQSY